ncbi:MAG: hypothetical protein ACP5HM_04730 [Anaerolineae bacterium]
MNYRRLIGVILTWALCLALLPAQSVQAATYTVTNTNDSGDGSLRWAIEQANVNPGPDTIQFNITGCGGVCTIQPTSVLPTITDDETTIDGYSQPGASPATADEPATILVEIDGSLIAADTWGLAMTSANNLVQGLSITDFGWDGIAIAFGSATGNVVAGNYLGIDPAGADEGNGHSGVFIGQGAQENLVGGDTPAERNVLSGNVWSGVEIHGSGTMSNTVTGNYIGTDATGMARVRNALYGVRIYGGAQRNTIGGNTTGERNVISGNGEDGVRIVGADTDDNIVCGNHIGLAADGSTELVNSSNGVQISGDAEHNIVGGDEAGERNVISGNGQDGVYIEGENTIWNVVSGNYIGLAADGSTAVGNALSGVSLRNGAHYTMVGGDEAGERNVLSGNEWYGVFVTETENNTVRGNYIGTDAAGTSALPNHFGVFISVFAQHNYIGPDNVISGNERYGVGLYGMETMSNTVHGNIIGADVTGQTALANGENGVYLSVGAQYNFIGPDNIISGNDQHGVYISQEGVDYNTVMSNTIGVAADGTTALGNAACGVFIDDGPQHNRVEGNVISANDYGVWIQGAIDEVVVTRDNVVIENFIGVAANGLSPLGNSRDGVHISMRGQSNTVAVNLIAHNGDDGVTVDTPTAFDNLIWMNSIHDNDGLGIHLTNGANNGIGAPTIYGFDLDTMIVSGAACPGCLVQIYASPDNDGEGQRFLWVGEAGPAGDFDISVTSLPYPYLTATATDFADGTSEFSEVFTVSMPVLATSTKTVTAPQPMPGQPLTYTLTLTNTGTSAASTTLTDTLPTEVTWADDYTVSSGALIWDAGERRLLWSSTVNVGTSESIVYRVTVNDDVADGAVITNTATVDDGVNVHELGPASVTIDLEHIYLPLVARRLD